MYTKIISKYHRFNQLQAFVAEFFNNEYSTIKMHNQYPLQGISSQDSINTCMHQKFGGNFTGNETVFDKILDIFKDTEIEKVIQFLDVPVYRSRLFLMPPGHEMSIHTDASPRIHIPILTSKGNEFWFWKDTPVWTKIQDADMQNLVYREHLPANGNVYLVDTRELHSFVNHSNEFRIHLVFGVK